MFSPISQLIIVQFSFRKMPLEGENVLYTMGVSLEGLSQHPVRLLGNLRYSFLQSSHNYSITNQADMLEHLLKQLNIGSVTILAHDYGDTVTQELISRYQFYGKFQFFLSPITPPNPLVIYALHKTQQSRASHESYERIRSPVCIDH